MALYRIGANAILLGPGSLTLDKVNLLKGLNCKMIVYDSKMKESQRKQLFEGINQLTQHNAVSNIEKQILVSLSSVAEELEGAHCHTYKSLLAGGQSLDQQNLRKAQSEVQFDDPIVAMFTSGSTGKPKIVQHTTHSCVNFFRAASAENPWDIGYIDRPFSWVGGYFYSQASIGRNITIVCVPTEISLSSKGSESIIEIWEKEKCTLCPINISLIHKIHKENLHLKYNLSHIKVFVIGGQRYSLDVVAKLFSMFPSSVIMLAYGSTESPLITTEIVKKESAVEGNFGKMALYPGVEVKIVDDEDKIVPISTAGEICTRNCMVFLEYVGDIEATKRAKSRTGWLRTGDTGIMYDDAKIEVIGRKTDIIKRAAVKIFPAEIEKVLLQHPTVADVVVVGIPDQRLHEEICACVVLKDTEGGPSEKKTKLQELENWSKEQWPPGPDGLSLAPKYFLAVKEFPFTATGKVSSQQIKADAMHKILEKSVSNIGTN